MTRPRLVGINHVALEVGNVDEALAFYGKLFEFGLQERQDGAVFLDMGDQFLALVERRAEDAHFGLVVDDKDATRRSLADAGVEATPGRKLDFHDPWGNRVQVVQYDQIQFTKPDHIVRTLGAVPGKSAAAEAELRARGLL